MDDRAASGSSPPWAAKQTRGTAGRVRGRRGAGGLAGGARRAWAPRALRCRSRRESSSGNGSAQPPSPPPPPPSPAPEGPGSAASGPPAPARLANTLLCGLKPGRGGERGGGRIRRRWGVRLAAGRELCAETAPRHAAWRRAGRTRLHVLEGPRRQPALERRVLLQQPSRVLPFRGSVRTGAAGPEPPARPALALQAQARHPRGMEALQAGAARSAATLSPRPGATPALPRPPARSPLSTRTCTAAMWLWPCP
jgi:hypothetical protein